MINCPNCRCEISAQAPICPKCGRKMKLLSDEESRLLYRCLLLVVIGCVIIVYRWFGGPLWGVIVLPFVLFFVGGLAYVVFENVRHSKGD